MIREVNGVKLTVWREWPEKDSVCTTCGGLECEAHRVPTFGAKATVSLQFCEGTGRVYAIIKGKKSIADAVRVAYAELCRRLRETADEIVDVANDVGNGLSPFPEDIAVQPLRAVE
jgi:hypothetical protein